LLVLLLLALFWCLARLLFAGSSASRLFPALAFLLWQVVLVVIRITTSLAITLIATRNRKIVSEVSKVSEVSVEWVAVILYLHCLLTDGAGMSSTRGTLMRDGTGLSPTACNKPGVKVK
tara:strand:+ start:238 stop:594 length:357 start_codon:yes stop_codon:yes gene_type:complete